MKVVILEHSNSVVVEETTTTVELGSAGPQGASGAGVPAGGVEFQILSKSSDDDFDTEWINPGLSPGIPIGGSEGFLLSKATDDDFDDIWIDPATVGVTDHGELTGLSDDDHPQYTTDAEATAIADSEADSKISTHSAITDVHHSKSHAHSGADGSGTVAHSATTGQTATDHHTNVNDPTTDEKAALAGTSGTAPSGSNKLVDSADSRLSDARTPTAHKTSHEVGGGDAVTITHAQTTGQTADQHHAQAHHAAHEPSGADPMAVDAVAGTGSLRTLGSGPVQAASGNHIHGAGDAVLETDEDGVAVVPSTSRYDFTHGLDVTESAEDTAQIDVDESELSHNLLGGITATDHHSNVNDPSADEKAALAGTSGSPSSSNKYLTNADSRNTNARTPTSHHGTHGHGGTDEVFLNDLIASGDVGFGNHVPTTLGAPVDSSDGTRKSYVDGADATHAALPNVHHTSANDPTSGQKAALAGTSGTPGLGNQYVTDSDSRNSDTRTPTSHHTSHETGGSDPTVITHAQTTGQTTDDHHAKSHAHSGADGSGTVAHSALTGITATDHATPVSGPDADVTIDGAGAAGTSSTFARSAHGHKLTTYASAPPKQGVGSAGTSGTAPARGDHVHPYTTVIKTSTTTLSSQTTLQSDPHLLFAISNSATEVWFVEGTLLVQAANGVMDFKCSWSVPSGCVMEWGWGVTSITTSGFAQVAVGTTSTGLVGAGTALGAGTVNGTIGLKVAGWVYGGGTAGNVVFQWAQNTSDGNNLSLKVNSFLVPNKLVA